MEAKKIIFIIVFYIAIIGALNWGFHALGYNLVQRIANCCGDNAKNVENGIYYLVAVCGLAACVMFSIDLYNQK